MGCKQKQHCKPGLHVNNDRDVIPQPTQSELSACTTGTKPCQQRICQERLQQLPHIAQVVIQGAQEWETKRLARASAINKRICVPCCAERMPRANLQPPNCAAKRSVKRSLDATAPEQRHPPISDASRIAFVRCETVRAQPACFKTCSPR